MTDTYRRDHPALDFRSPPQPLPDQADAMPPQTLLASFDKGECRAWIAAILAMRAHRGGTGTSSG